LLKKKPKKRAIFAAAERNFPQKRKKEGGAITSQKGEGKKTGHRTEGRKISAWERGLSALLFENPKKSARGDPLKQVLEKRVCARRGLVHPMGKEKGAEHVYEER